MGHGLVSNIGRHPLIDKNNAGLKYEQFVKDDFNSEELLRDLNFDETDREVDKQMDTLRKDLEEFKSTHDRDGDNYKYGQQGFNNFFVR